MRSSIYQEGVDTVYFKDEWRVVYIKREWGAAIYIKEEWDQFISRGSGRRIYQEGMRDGIYQGVGSSIYQERVGAVYIKEERGQYISRGSGEHYISRRRGGAFNIKQWGAVYIKEEWGAFNIKQWGAVYIKEWVDIYIKRE